MAPSTILDRSHSCRVNKGGYSNQHAEPLSTLIIYMFSRVLLSFTSFLVHFFSLFLSLSLDV